jgi:hypothetical protein
MLLSISAGLYAGDLENNKIRIGLKLFRTILAADLEIANKKDSAGQLSLRIVYKQDKQQAEVYAEKLSAMGKGKNKGKIKGVTIKIRLIHINDLPLSSLNQAAGLYIVEDLEQTEISRIIDFGIKHQRITYSPFAQHIEQGIAAGLLIESRVKPTVNLKTLRASKIKLKSFFLKVAKYIE